MSESTMYDDACEEMVDFLRCGIVSSPDTIETPLTDDAIEDLMAYSQARTSPR